MSKLSEKIKKYKNYIRNSVMYFTYYHVSIRKNMILAVSRDGEDVADNILSILKELQKEGYEKYTIYMYLQDRVLKAKKRILENNGLSHVRVITSKKVLKVVLEMAGYIITDSSLDWGYVKRPGQVLINTWHGTPFKVMGRSNPGEKHTVGGVQKVFLASDYLLYANEFMKKIMIRDYMLENVCQAKCLCSGYPRNSQFFDSGAYEAQRAKLGLKGQIITYMPTFRGTFMVRRNEEQVAALQDYLVTIENLLRDDQTFFVKLHNYNMQQIDLSKFKKVKPFPEGCATYDVLAATDILVSDYSSVFFDFANTRRKIILFAYDEASYFADRGVYFPFSDLPFAKVETVERLIEEINSPDTVDYPAFFEKFGYYDNADATRNVCQHIFKGIPSCAEEPVPYNGKENILVYAGGMAKNGITSALFNFISKLDKSDHNYIISFQAQEVKKEPARVNVIPQNINYMPIADNPAATLAEHKAYQSYLHHDLPIDKLQEAEASLPSKVERYIRREWERFYGQARIHKVIQFDGYNVYLPLLFALSGKPSAIWVHNDLVQEKLTKNRNHMATLKYCYNTYSMTAVVNDSLHAPTERLGASKDKILTVFNCYDEETFHKKSLLPLRTDSDTMVCGSFEGSLEEKLKKAKPAFITVGRFSPEKGHDRLLRAFNSFHAEHPESCLLIIGGYGPMFNETVKLANALPCREDVIIIKSLTNPAPFLRACDCFVLSSFHEGLPVVLFEAASVGLSAISTRIPAVEDFLKQHGGLCVDNSEEGILSGMEAFARGEVAPLEIDFEEFNRKSISAFNRLMNSM